MTLHHKVSETNAQGAMRCQIILNSLPLIPDVSKFDGQFGDRTFSCRCLLHSKSIAGVIRRLGGEAPRALGTSEESVPTL